MKLDQRHEQQCECGQQRKGNLKFLRKKKATKTKHPSHEHHHLKLAPRVRLQNLERDENNKERYPRLNAFQRTITGEDGEHRRGCEQHLQSCKPKTVTLAPSEFHRKREQKNPRDPAHERSKHGGNVKSNAAASQSSGRRGILLSLLLASILIACETVRAAPASWRLSK